MLTAILTAMSAVIFANDVPSASRSAHPIVSTETTLFLPSPAVWDAATFESGDPLLNAVWDKGILYLESARASGFDDVFFGETPEAFGVDARIARAYAWYTGDICPLEAALYRFYLTGVDAYSNGYFLWPETLLRYLDFGGDTVKARLWARHALPEMAARLERFTGETGLLGADVLEEADAAMDVPSLNAFYYHFLDTAANAARRLDLPAERYASSARDVRAAFRDTFWDDDCQCVLVPDDSLDGGILANALAVLFGFVALDEDDAIIQYIRTEGAAVDAAYQPYIVEACFRAGEYRLGYDMLTFFTDPRATVSVVHLIPEYVAGLEQRGATVRVAPRFGPQTAFARLHTPVVGGRASVHYDRDHGVRVLLPPDTEAGVRATLGEPVVVKNVVSHGESELTPEQIARLEAKGWSERVGDERAIWVSVGEQRLRCIQNGRILYEARSAAAEKGIGSEMNSLKTPIGWHEIARKVGDDAPWGQVFRARSATREIWQPGEDVTEDLVLSRILLLDGLEPGLNKGGSVDSFARHIYIHGTNDEARLGTPSSHGCIRLSNDDVIELYRHVPKGTKVLITEF